MNGKFRVWDNENCEYSQEYFVIKSDGLPMWLSRDDGGKNGIHEHVVSFEKDRFIVEFSTGLKDKNGKEIYGGDVVRFTSEFDDVTETAIVFHDGAWDTKSDIAGWDQEYDPILHTLPEERFELEVIGTIHDEVKP